MATANSYGLLWLSSYVEVTHTFVKPNRCIREQYSCNCSKLRVDVVIIKASYVEVLYALPVSLYVQSVGSWDNSPGNC